MSEDSAAKGKSTEGPAADSTAKGSSPEKASRAPKSMKLAPARLRPSLGISGRTNARMTLFGTSLVFAVTLFAWGGAKVACNLHPPKSEAFKPAPIARLAATPKDGALEFHHRLSIRDFDGARELAASSAIPLVNDAMNACDPSCRSGAADRARDVVTRAIVVSRQGATAVVRAESFYEGQPETRTYRVTWEERLWKVIGLAE